MKKHTSSLFCIYSKCKLKITNLNKSEKSIKISDYYLECIWDGFDIPPKCGQDLFAIFTGL